MFEAATPLLLFFGGHWRALSFITTPGDVIRRSVKRAASVLGLCFLLGLFITAGARAGLKSEEQPGASSPHQPGPAWVDLGRQRPRVDLGRD